MKCQKENTESIIPVMRLLPSLFNLSNKVILEITDELFFILKKKKKITFYNEAEDENIYVRTDTSIYER